MSQKKSLKIIFLQKKNKNLKNIFFANKKDAILLLFQY